MGTIELSGYILLTVSIDKRVWLQEFMISCNQTWRCVAFPLLTTSFYTLKVQFLSETN